MGRPPRRFPRANGIFCTPHSDQGATANHMDAMDEQPLHLARIASRCGRSAFSSRLIVSASVPPQLLRITRGASSPSSSPPLRWLARTVMKPRPRSDSSPLSRVWYLEGMVTDRRIAVGHSAAQLWAQTCKVAVPQRRHPAPT